MLVNIGSAKGLVINLRHYWLPDGIYLRQCSAKALEKWGPMTHTIEKYGDIGNFSGVTFVMLPFMNLKLVGTWPIQPK